MSNPSSGPGGRHDENEESKMKEKEYDVVINGTPVTLEDDTASYEQVTTLAFPGHGPDVQFAVKYRNAIAPHGGSGILTAGESVRIKKRGTSFDVRLANRS